MAASTRRRSPLWARICVGVGAVVLLAGGGTLVAGKALVAKYTDRVTDESLLAPIAAKPAEAAAPPPVKSDIDGPVNILLVGIDPRDEHTAPLADSIVIAHIPRDRHSAYLFSMPRDLRVDIPAFAKSGTGADRTKINAAMSYGSRLGDGRYSAAQGFQLLATTVGNVTGIKRFDAGAIVNFGGFKKIVEAMGGVEMVIDMDVRSEHLKPDGSTRDRISRCEFDHTSASCMRPYTGVQKTYKKSTEPVRLKAWEALDYVRQRYGENMSDYDRQRHQQQFIKAMAKQALSRDVLTDPGKLLDVMDAAGDSLTFAGGGHTIVEWALELKSLNIDDMITVKLPGESVYGDGYLGEKFGPGVDDFFKAVTEDRVAAFLMDHPTYINETN
ncbi:Anionic cell wall polymer biosynthesis enzyme, LytR-Cps2A-Psr (LCP) family [Actinoplanes philippinensis]|uniref:Anionic cell wall polymer biosynthesis enzyme, LytR-Cps2A-Psr (LCP) family n=1 Tax=Actinoplanes philippinensis TaxID=35752 RepID=A0A1I2F863_9ACTN|nr:LCP family protein [Actinoplanes philippinensis]SFF00786.1 Anionic cell wall polymer biosynthesis enzyme, LytR-Cps2A-Psr (LCP) family [Actinoplanes philippinensis]